MNDVPDAYVAKRIPRTQFVEARGFGHHVLHWESSAAEDTQVPPLLLVHGYMDVGASFQFLVDALAAREGTARAIFALDLRGFGSTQTPPVDAYWFLDYLGDLDAVSRQLFGDTPFDLLGHSMGGNVCMIYAGVRPARVRRLINLEGFGLPATQPEEAPARYTKWLDQLALEQTLPTFDDYAAVAARLCRNNPRLSQDKAQWLARHWSYEAEGRYRVRGDAAHKRVNPVLYREGEALACWANITAPVLCAEGRQTPVDAFWGGRYSLSAYRERLRVVRDVRSVVLEDAGHMLHHDQPEALAEHVAAFLRDA